jgi:hypothetical protein
MPRVRHNKKNSYCDAETELNIEEQAESDSVAEAHLIRERTMIRLVNEFPAVVRRKQCNNLQAVIT